MMALHVPIPGKRFRMHALVIPVDDRTTRLLVVSARDFATFRLLDPFFDRMNAVIAGQDQAVVETDRATLHFRKYYLEELQRSS
jgi:hypothetical protein